MSVASPGIVPAVRTRRSFCTLAAFMAIGCSDSKGPDTGAGLRFQQVVAGNGFSCALADGSAYCWGRNDVGQLGRGTATDAGTPAEVAGGHRFRALAASDRNVCGLTDAGRIMCWGQGQLLLQGSPLTEPTALPGPVTFDALAVGLTHGCGRTTDDEVWCWGQNYAGQLGGGTQDGSASPRKVAGTLAFTQLDVGALHTCGLSGTDVWCWGANIGLALGAGSELGAAYVVPRRVPLAFAATAIETGPGFTCTRAETGAWCWGMNSTGQLGGGSSGEPSPEPVALSLTAAVASLHASSVNSIHSHACALAPVGEAWCWGAAGSGRLGRMASDSCQGIPCAPVPGRAAPGLSFDGLAPGLDHTCGLTKTGDVHCWGSNAWGQLGTGAGSDSTEPVKVRAGP